MKVIHGIYLLLFTICMLSLTSCVPHPDRHLIVDMEAGEAKVDSEDLVIVEFTLDRIGPVRLREFLAPLDSAESKVHFEPISEGQFLDSSSEHTTLRLKAWAIDTLRRQEYRFSRWYHSWEEASKDTALNIDGVAAPKYTHYIED